MSLDVSLSAPVVCPHCGKKLSDEYQGIYSNNITHNLGKMANAAGIYKYLWRPDEISITKAIELIEPLRAGLVCLKAHPERFKKLNPENGWGDYEGLIAFVADYLAACEKNPTADISVSR